MDLLTEKAPAYGPINTLKKYKLNTSSKLLGLNITVKILLVFSFEAVLLLAILMTVPFDSSSPQMYEFLVLGELLAVILLTPWSVFVVAGLNALFIATSLLYQSHTTAFNQDLYLQFWPILLRPVIVQVLVALISYLAVTHMATSIKHAHMAEMRAMEAQMHAETQKAEAERNMLLFQNGVECIVRKHALLMNQQLYTKIPLTDYEPVLWPLINAFNSLQNRLQHTYQIEHELQDIQGAISTHLALIDQGNFSFDQPVHTHTALDVLLNSLCEMLKEYQHHEDHSSSLDMTNARTLKLRLEDIWLIDSQELYARGKQLNCAWESDYFKYTRGK